MARVIENGQAHAGSSAHAARLTVRPARAGDADACAPLIFESGKQEFGFLLGGPPDECIAFLRFVFAAATGRFSYQRHFVAVDGDGRVCSILAAHDGRFTMLDDPHLGWSFLRFFGLRRAGGIAARGLVLERELPAPKRNQILLAHCATHKSVRGRGVFTTLFEGAMRAGFFEVGQDRQLLLDVLVSNWRVHALYRRLGFIDMPRINARSRKLPAALESMRMCCAALNLVY